MKEANALIHKIYFEISFLFIYFAFQSTFMNVQSEPLQDLRHIKNLMERSSRFVSLSGLSGIAAGVWALLGAYFGYTMIADYYDEYARSGFTVADFQGLKIKLLMLSGGVLLLAIISAFFFTWRKAKQSKVSLWGPVSRRLAINTLIPLVTGGLMILAALQHDDWSFVAPMALVFYGLALVNGSKYTFGDIRYLGICEIILGLANTQFVGYGLYFWAAGFGVLHIIYGLWMWNKYEKGEEKTA